MARAGAIKKKDMTLRGHLLELRNRFFLVFGVLIIVATIAYMFREPLIAGLLAPLEGRQLQYLTPGGGFKFIFSVIFFAGLAAAIPLLIQQVYAFLSPVLSTKVRSRSGWLLLWSTVLLAAGVTFGYVYAVPGALNFLYGFADQFVVSALTADAYLDFVIKYTLGLGLMFQIPLIMIIVHWIKPQKPLKLLKFERWVILIAFILAAFITPTPDPVNQTIIAVPIIAVYQIGLLMICLNIWRGNKVARQQKRHAKKENRHAVKQARKAKTPEVQPVLEVAAEIAPPVIPEATETISPTTMTQDALRPQRSIDGIVMRSAAGTRVPTRVTPPVVTVPERPVTTLPRATPPGARRPLSIDGMTRMMSV